MFRLRANKVDFSFSSLGSVSDACRIALRYTSRRDRSRLARSKSCVARTKAPGLPRTVDRSVSKSPPVSGARNNSICSAPLGTVTTTPSARTCLSQVSILVNQLSGGGFVDPRRNVGINK